MGYNERTLAQNAGTMVVTAKTMMIKYGEDGGTHIIATAGTYEDQILCIHSEADN